MTYACDAADAGASFLMRNTHALHLVIFYPALLIWTRIYRRWTKREGHSTSERRLLCQQHHTHASCYSPERVVKTDEEKKLLNKVVILVYFAHKKYSRSFIKLRLNHWCHMNYFNDVLTPFLGLERGSCIAVYAESESSQISSKIS